MEVSSGIKTMGLIRRFLMWMLFAGLMIGGASVAVAQTGPAKPGDDSLTVMQKFNEHSEAKGGVFKLTDKAKHQVLFVMGASLLVMIGLTAYFGLSMAFGGKDVFVGHMICAGLTVTLAVAHAVTSFVWFFPF
ncbi:MAG: hypothetical protein HY272_06605 [Gammaproteobacteria bacterium]|nr:hypothetical protein [Gammaproteobacteria bacterium]